MARLILPRHWRGTMHWPCCGTFLGRSISVPGRRVDTAASRTRGAILA